jgi:hypothetical protein
MDGAAITAEDGMATGVGVATMAVAAASTVVVVASTVVVAFMAAGADMVAVATGSLPGARD